MRDRVLTRTASVTGSSVRANETKSNILIVSLIYTHTHKRGLSHKRTYSHTETTMRTNIILPLTSGCPSVGAASE